MLFFEVQVRDYKDDFDINMITQAANILKYSGPRVQVIGALESQLPYVL